MSMVGKMAPLRAGQRLPWVVALPWECWEVMGYHSSWGPLTPSQPITLGQQEGGGGGGECCVMERQRSHREMVFRGLPDRRNACSSHVVVSPSVIWCSNTIKPLYCLHSSVRLRSSPCCLAEESSTSAPPACQGQPQFGFSSGKQYFKRAGYSIVNGLISSTHKCLCRRERLSSSLLGFPLHDPANPAPIIGNCGYRSGTYLLGLNWRKFSKSSGKHRPDAMLWTLWNLATSFKTRNSE